MSKVIFHTALLCIIILAQGCSCFKLRLADTRHIARKGDTLKSLAVTYYGSENKIAVLIRANPDLQPGEPLVAGTRVEIPVD